VSEKIRIGESWYVLATSARTDERLQVLKCDETFAMFDRFGDIQPWEAGEQGLYRDDTRFLSHQELLIDGHRPLHLGSTMKEDRALLIVELMNPDLPRGGELAVPKGTIHVLRAKLLWEGACHEHIRLSNHGLQPVSVSVELRLDADYVDLFEVRGMRRAKRGTPAPREQREDELVFGYRGLDDCLRRTRVRFEPCPDTLVDGQACFALNLAPGQEAHLYCSIDCCIGDDDAAAPARLGYRDAFRLNEARQQAGQGRCHVTSSNPLMNRWLERSIGDLGMLTTALPTGPYPCAGVPWYATTLGRDGLITAHQCLWNRPELAKGVLAFLAATQATALDPLSDAEPGKILHEARSSEMARTREIPFGRYYGSVDSTPLFVLLAGAYHRRTADLGFIRSIWPNIVAALDWIDRYGDPDGDGFVEYARRSPDGLVQQGWKDSHDSVFHADGTMAEPPIALAEVQAYVYQAKLEGAALCRVLGEPQRAERLEAAAQDLRQEFQQRFWCEELGLYAIALDGAKRACRVASTNGAHALWTSIAAPEHAERIARQLFHPDLFSGWGLRTIASGQARYNPMSYHNGSIWPHDNALICVGLARYGHGTAALRVLDALYDASLYFEQHRLPELFCGFPRREGEGPTRYPVACSPQAWASAAVFGMLEACLGLECDGAAREVRLHVPRLPRWLDWLHVRELEVAGAKVDLLLKRYEHSVGVEVTAREGDLAVRVVV
jgi:glycogen debranching enzyme